MDNGGTLGVLIALTAASLVLFVVVMGGGRDV